MVCALFLPKAKRRKTALACATTGLTPYFIITDYDTLNTVAVFERDTINQERIPVGKVIESAEKVDVNALLREIG